jgi:hypothetical protein
MIPRFEHHPILMEMALATVVCVLLMAVTLIVAALSGPPGVPSVDLNAAPSHSEIVRRMLLQSPAGDRGSFGGAMPLYEGSILRG